MKPTRHIILMAAMLLCSFAASAQIKVEIDGIWYNLTSETLQAEVTFKGDYSWDYEEYSGSTTIPAIVTYEGKEYSVTSIGYDAFYGCSSLTRITIPEGVTSIGSYAFSGCSILTTINIPEGVTSIGDCAFYDCSSLTAITIPEDVMSIGERTFYSCSSLTAIIVEEGNEVYDSRNGCNAIIETNSNTLIQGCSTTIIPESVTSIGEGAFFGSGLESITIPEDVTSIGDYAFFGCSSLTAINIPEGVTSIGDEAFYDCSSLKTITIPEGVTSIGDYAFRGCSNLTAITIPEGVTSIGDCAFSGCWSLTAITIPESVRSIGSYAFSNCISLTGITIPEGVRSIGDYAFFGCSSLTAITIPESVTSIGSYAFSWCSSLTAITIPENVEFIYSEAFAGCWALGSIKVLATEPPFAYDNTFPYYSIELCVPEEAMEAYRTTTPWSKFTSIRNLEGEEVGVKQCAAPMISYVDGQVVLTCETEGVTFVSETTASGIAQRQVATFDLTVTYTITAYATKEDYLNSEATTVTICWVDCTEEHVGEGDETDIITIPAQPVLIQTQGGVITLSGLAEGTAVTVYDLDGTLQGTATATGGTATITTDLTAGSVAVVQIGGRSVKVAIK